MGGDILGPVGAVDDPAGLHELGVGARAGDAVGQGEPGEGALLHALDQNGDGQIRPARGRSCGAGALQAKRAVGPFVIAVPRQLDEAPAILRLP
jgi:hypothetical protein